jgi:hypothetical protein
MEFKVWTPLPLSPSSLPPPPQLHLTAYYSKLLAIFGQQFAYLQYLLNFSMETKDEEGGRDLSCA